MLCRISTGGQGRVAHGRHRIGVSIARVGEDRTVLHQVTETALAEPVEVATDHVSTQLVNRDLQHETGFVGLQR